MDSHADLNVNRQPPLCLPHAVMPATNKLDPRPAQGSAATADLIRELERNAQYYSADRDREAGDLLWRAAQALAYRL
jgi:hypothetical protein